MQAKSKNQIEISEFIDDTVSSAIVRHGLGFEAEASLTTLSEEEVNAIRGGLKIKRSDLLGEFSQENRLKI